MYLGEKGQNRTLKGELHVNKRWSIVGIAKNASWDANGCVQMATLVFKSVTFYQNQVL